eukprot:gene15969-7301_t
MTSNYYESLDATEKANYRAKLTLSSGEAIPDRYILQSEWSNDIANLPELSWRDVTEYLIDSPSNFSKESMKAYKSLEAYDYFVCKHVQDCFYHKISDASEFCFVKSEPTASTSLLCAWKSSKKHVIPAPLSSIDFSQPRKKTLPKPQTNITEYKNYSCLDPTVGEDAISVHMLKKLHKIYPKAAVFTSLPLYDILDNEAQSSEKDAQMISGSGSETDTDIENSAYTLPEPLTSLFDPTAINMTDEDLQVHGRKLYTEYRERNFQKSYDNLFWKTKDQSAKKEWMLHRAGRITGSTVKNVARMRDSQSLIETIMQYRPGFSSKYTAHGKQMEPVAREKFEKEEGMKHTNFKVEQAGLLINAEIPYLGASPDGIVSCDCHGRGVLEIKCPYNYKDSFEGWAEDNKFPIDPEYKMRENHRYYYQIQLQMELAGVDFGYFYVFSAGVDEAMLCLTIKNKTFMEELKNTLFNKFLHTILPEVVSRKLDTGHKHDRKLFCICRGPEFGNMITCKNQSCEIGRYHYSCVNIKRAPRNGWVCQNCA